MSSLKHFTLENELNENKDNIIGKFTEYVKNKIPNNDISLKNISNYIKVTIEIVEKSKFENSNKMKFALLILCKLSNDLKQIFLLMIKSLIPLFLFEIMHSVEFKSFSLKK